MTANTNDYKVSDDGTVTFYKTRSQLAEALLSLKGKPFRLDPYYPMHRAIYDGDYKSLVLMTCRQIGKSTTWATFSVSESIAIPHFSTLFLAPSQEQTLKFSTERVGRLIHYSPYVQKYFVAEKSSDRVLLRSFSNGSSINFSYVSDDPDRVRGISADRTAFDEVQDMLIDVVAPVVNEVLRESDYRYQSYSGTPKSMENGLQGLWEESTQTEWVMKCVGCNSWNAIRSEKSFGKHGPVCLKCDHLLDPRTGQWVDFVAKAKHKGFHISRAIMPRNVPACWRPGTEDYDKAVAAWDEIWYAKNHYPITTFRNEVVGVSDSQGRRIITRADLKEMCTGPRMMQKPDHNTNMKTVGRVVAGIDWSGGGTEEKSKTVLTIWGLLPGGKYRLLWFKMYPGMAPIDEAKEIMDTLAMYGGLLSYVAGDAGEGNVYIDMLRKRFGHQRIVKLRYVESDYYVQWNQKAQAYMVNRTRAIDSLMMAMHRRDFEFPADPDGKLMKEPFDNILAEHEETTGQEGGVRKKVWRHSKNQPDDFLHAMNFARVAMQLAIGELNLTASE